MLTIAVVTRSVVRTCSQGGVTLLHCVCVLFDRLICLWGSEKDGCGCMGGERGGVLGVLRLRSYL